MADLERTYNIPLRKEFRKVPKYKRAKKAMTAVREFLVKHMKSEEVLIGQEINMELWKDGIKRPPHHVKVTAIKDSEGVVRAELAGHDYKTVEQQAKSEEDTSLVGRMKKKMGVDEKAIAREEAKEADKEAKDKKEAPKKEEPKTEEKKEESKQEVKKEVKAEPKKEAPKKEVKKEAPKQEVKKEAPKQEVKKEEQKSLAPKKAPEPAPKVE
ncbi:50S ribosomal protein L31e, partial [Thermoproteota archaeon]